MGSAVDLIHNPNKCMVVQAGLSESEEEHEHDGCLQVACLSGAGEKVTTTVNMSLEEEPWVHPLNDNYYDADGALMSGWSAEAVAQSKLFDSHCFGSHITYQNKRLVCHACPLHPFSLLTVLNHFACSLQNVKKYDI